VCSHPFTLSRLGEMMCVFAPACSNACFGEVNSTCSKPSSTKIATFFPFKLCIRHFLQSHCIEATTSVMTGYDVGRLFDHHSLRPLPPCLTCGRALQPLPQRARFLQHDMESGRGQWIKFRQLDTEKGI